MQDNKSSLSPKLIELLDRKEKLSKELLTRKGSSSQTGTTSKNNSALKTSHTKEQASPYRILGIQPDATQSEIFAAYRLKAMTWHPDRHPEHKKKQAKACFHLIKNAYESIKTAERRAQYDRARVFLKKQAIVNDNKQLGKKAIETLGTLFWPFEDGEKSKKNDYLSDIDKIRL